MANIGHMLFSIKLTNTAVHGRLAWPSCWLNLLPFGDGASNVEFHVKAEDGSLWRFRCSVRKAGYPKPIISSGWLPFVKSQGGVQAGDEVIFYQNEDPNEALFVVSVRRINLDLNVPAKMSSGQHQEMCSSPVFSNQDNWFESMLQSCVLYQMEQPHQPVSDNDARQESHSHLNESPHLLELQGSPRMSLNSEETRRRKRSRICEDADAGNDDRQVKCRFKSSQSGTVSDSDATCYFSVSTGCSSQGSTTVECTSNARQKGIVYWALNRVSDFLHQLKNYVA